MEIRDFTEDDYPAIVNIHNSLNIVWPERPYTPESWAQIEQNRHPKCKHHRWVAVQDGDVVGFGSYGQNIFELSPAAVQHHGRSQSSLPATRDWRRAL
ncbi:MAG: hypothetical protein KC415_21380 [Anaerolineales bacterium]|nr:hypothetical protein [Anaerolineales bacterium]MCB9004148.1 hypothetical protein [Ardenticatenaceae bacterium]